MIELDVDMEYCLDADMLGYIILHDENGEMDDMVFVPERKTTRNGKFKTKYGRRVPLCEHCDYAIGDERYNYCPKCGARVVE